MEATHAVVVEIGDRSFIRVNNTRGYWYDHDKIAANGCYPLAKAPGDDSFLVYEGSVERLEKVTPPRRITTKYVLRDDLRGAAKPDPISVADYGALAAADQALYQPVTEDIPQEAEAIPFVVQHERGEPSKLPRGIVSIDQHYFARFPAFWHLGPVRATAKYVLWRTAKRLAEIIAENPYIKWSSGWGRDVDEYLSSEHRTSFFIEVKPLRVNGIEVSAKAFGSMFTTDSKERSLHYARVVQAVEAENLPALDAKVAAYVEELTEQARKWVAPDRCPCCQRRFKQGGARAR